MIITYKEENNDESSRVSLGWGVVAIWIIVLIVQIGYLGVNLYRTIKNWGKAGEKYDKQRKI